MQEENRISGCMCKPGASWCSWFGCTFDAAFYSVKAGNPPKQKTTTTTTKPASGWVCVPEKAFWEQATKESRKSLFNPFPDFSHSHTHTLYTQNLSLSAVPIWDFSSPFRWLSMAWPWTQIVLPTTLLRFFYERVRAKRSEKKFFQIFIFSDSGRCHLVLLVLPPPPVRPSHPASVIWFSVVLGRVRLMTELQIRSSWMHLTYLACVGLKMSNYVSLRFCTFNQDKLCCCFSKR